jgi:hypothetical protein
VILIEAVVIGFEREGNHQMIAARMFHQNGNSSPR